MKTSVLLVLLAVCGSSLAETCGIAEALDKLIQEKIDTIKESCILDVIGSGESCYMGMKDSVIPNDAITASSFWSATHEPFQARLDNKFVSGVTTGSWSTRLNQVGQWLQVDFGEVKHIAGAITQGRPHAYDQWVRSYKVSCGTTLENMEMVMEGGEDKVFKANSDKDTKVYNRFPQVLSCRYIRIYPQLYNNHMSMRAEFVKGVCFFNPNLP